jgi:RNA polymerase sigma factor (sigma-70 family)
MARFRYDPALGRFQSYLGRVVENAIRRQQSRPSGEPRLLEEEALVAVASSNDVEVLDSWEEEWRLHHLRLAMQTLRETSKERDVAILDRLLGGESVADVAGSTGLSTEAVHKIKQRLRDRLRAHVTAQLRDEDGLEA